MRACVYFISKRRKQDLEREGVSPMVPSRSVAEPRLEPEVGQRRRRRERSEGDWQGKKDGKEKEEREKGRDRASAEVVAPLTSVCQLARDGDRAPSCLDHGQAHLNVLFRRNFLVSLHGAGSFSQSSGILWPAGHLRF